MKSNNLPNGIQKIAINVSKHTNFTQAEKLWFLTLNSKAQDVKIEFSPTEFMWFMNCSIKTMYTMF